MTSDAEKTKARHDHEDPRQVPPGIRHAIANLVPRVVNQGANRARSPPRFDRVVNWGRKAAHPSPAPRHAEGS